MTDAVTLRAPRVEDAALLAGLLNEHSRALTGDDDTTAGEVRAWFSIPGLDPAVDMRIAVGGDGRIVAYADIVGQAEGPLHVDLRFLPACEAAGGVLLAAMEERAGERGAPPRPLRVSAAAGDAALHVLLLGRGYRRVRSSFRMETTLGERLEPPTWPTDVAVRSYRAHDDLERVHAACDEAFADHWGYTATPLDVWRGMHVRDTLDPSLWLVAESHGDVAGVCLCRLDETPDPTLGWVSVLAVRRPWRRRGLARALLRDAFGRLGARGCDRVGLGVDAENVTGALRLYESVGMAVVRRSDTYERAVA